jgi:hypothetical protein
MKNNMKELFIPYEQALQIKELGFDEPCFGYYPNNEFKFFADVRSCNTNSEFGFYPTAPTYQQAFRWFREKHGLPSWVKEFNGARISYHFTINFRNNYAYDTLENNLEFKSYEEAELECLKILIQIAKKGNK